MKKFTQSIINEACTTASKNPGNNLIKTGVTNHYTPIQNILTNIKNLFCVHLGIVADEGEDGVSVKLTSSLFVNDQKINELLYMPLFNDVNYEGSCLASYIQAQGLTKITKVNIGGYIIVYFSPTDIQQAQDPNAMCKAGWCPMEAKESLYDEFEMTSIIKEDEEEKEVQDITLEKVMELLDSDDKVKAAKELELLVSKQISLPREYYFAAVKFKSGKEGIALRWKFTKNLPGGETTENVRSIMHIFGKGDEGIWVQDFAKDSIVELPEEVKKLIESVLDMLEAKETDDPAIFKLDGKRKERKEDEEDKDKDEDDKDSDNDEDKDKKKDNDKPEEDEDDSSRGDDSDLL